LFALRIAEADGQAEEWDTSGVTYRGVWSAIRAASLSAIHRSTYSLAGGNKATSSSPAHFACPSCTASSGVTMSVSQLIDP
jgi:hypothetical protein